MAKNSGPAGQGEHASKVGKVSSVPQVGIAQLQAGPGLSRSKISTKAPRTGTNRAARSLPTGAKGRR